MFTFIIIGLIIIAVGAALWFIGTIIYKKLRENEDLKYEFITIIAHKFRTPLTQIKWTIEGLMTDEQDPYKKEQIAQIHDSNENLIKLTGTLVELTDAAGKAESAYTFEPLNLCDMAHNAMESSKTAFHEKNLFMSLKCVAPEVIVSADRPRLDFVLATLMENACSYSPIGRNISIHILTEKKKAIVTVADNGIGIDARDIPHMFTKFFRTREAQAMDTEGLGVGLYLAKSIVKRFSGSLEVQSDGLDRGAVFSLILPLSK